MYSNRVLQLIRQWSLGEREIREREIRELASFPEEGEEEEARAWE